MSIENEQERTDKNVERVESDSERVERKLEDVDKAINQFEVALQKLLGGGDRKVAEAVQGNLKERQHEREQIEEEARKILRTLEDAKQDIRKIGQWNQEAKAVVDQLASSGEDVGEAQERIGERSQWLEKQTEQARSCQNRLEKMLRGYG